MNTTTSRSVCFCRRFRICGSTSLETLFYLSLASLILLVVGCGKLKPDPDSALRADSIPTLSSFDLRAAGEKLLPAGAIKFEQADLSQVLSVYADVSRRSIILGMNLPDTKFTFSNQSSMSAVEVLQALDTVLAAHGITTVFLGTQYLKVVLAKDAHLESGPIIELRPEQLPDSSSFLVYIVRSKKVTTSQALPVLSAFAKLPNSILAIPPPRPDKKSSLGGLPNFPISFGTQDTIFIFRDYSSNVRKMLKVLEELEQQ